MRSCKKQILGCYIKMEFPIFGKSTNFNNRKIKYNIYKTFYERKDIDEKQIKGKSLEKTKKDIEGAIDKIIDSFEGLLDKFYQEKELDIATDISAMEILMKQDGLSE